MKQLKKVGLTAALLSATTTALAHPGHEAIGDVLHVEYLFAAGIAVALCLTVWKRAKKKQ
ncbi:hypothetical protein [Marinobacter halotolerans]|uniref:hypothetical protein n=1 Tax=Marinobacter halotolerans TaxID=1569211 RepID=UPI001245AA78|nr:hypothetical protein [Marinobacter halotolerans]